MGMPQIQSGDAVKWGCRQVGMPPIQSGDASIQSWALSCRYMQMCMLHADQLKKMQKRMGEHVSLQRAAYVKEEVCSGLMSSALRTAW